MVPDSRKVSTLRPRGETKRLPRIVIRENVYITGVTRFLPYDTSRVWFFTSVHKPYVGDDYSGEGTPHK